MKNLLFTLCLLLGATTLPAQKLKQTVETQEEFEAKVRTTLALDYSMPDYSIKKLDEKVMGHRLAVILAKVNDTFTQYAYLSRLNAIQTSQIDDARLLRIEKMRLENITKTGHQIKVTYQTMLEPNSLGLKKSRLTFNFVDGISENRATNEYFWNLCKYIKE
jgi:hypothetical protein